MLTLAHITHAYGSTIAVHDCSLTLASAQRIAVIGPSGCGKSSLLRIIAGLEPSHQGTIHWHDDNITTVPAYQRHIGLMFQDHALFPHLTVAHNIGYGLNRQPAAERQQRVDELLQLIGLTALAQRYPDQLSGGERQRVALARSLAPKPRIVLFDEPFASLDRTLRDYLLMEVRELLIREQIAALYVTHDASEACAFADDIVVMRAGQIVAHATPAQLYQHPPSAFVAQLLGMRGVVAYQTCAEGTTTAFGLLPLVAPVPQGQLLIRPEAGIMAHQQFPASIMRGIVTQSVFRPPWQRVTICAHDDAQQTFEVDCGIDRHVAVGDNIEVAVAHAACTFLSQDSSPA